MSRKIGGLLALTLLVAACGADDDTDVAPPVSEMETVSTSTPPVTETPSSTVPPESTLESTTTFPSASTTTRPLDDTERRAGVPNTPAGFPVSINGDEILDTIGPALESMLILGGRLDPTLTRVSCDLPTPSEWGTAYVFGHEIAAACEADAVVAQLESFDGSAQIWIAPPPMGYSAEGDALRATMEDSSALSGRVVPNSDAVLVDRSLSQTCLDYEPCPRVGDGRSTVIGGSTGFCPSPALTGGCATFDAGSFRQALTVAAPIVASAYRDQTGVDTTTAPNPIPQSNPIERIEPLALAPSSVSLYGDSVADSSIDWIEALIELSGPIALAPEIYGGSSVCGWLDTMAAEAATDPPDVVVMIFSGNTFNPCMHDSGGTPLQGEAYYDKIRADLTSASTLYADAGSEVLLVDFPPSRGEAVEGLDGSQRLNDITRAVADADDRLTFVEASAAVLDGGHYTETLPCLPLEPCLHGTDADGNGVNLVREIDGVHFCPGGFADYEAQNGKCATWSSGALRYGSRISQAVVDALVARQSVD